LVRDLGLDLNAGKRGTSRQLDFW